MQRGTHLTVDSCSEGVPSCARLGEVRIVRVGQKIRVPSCARLGEVRIVHVGQKISTGDIEAILHCFFDAIQNCMNQRHCDVCHEADKQEKQADELVEAHLGKN